MEFAPLHLLRIGTIAAVVTFATGLYGVSGTYPGLYEVSSDCSFRISKTDKTESILFPIPRNTDWQQIINFNYVFEPEEFLNSVELELDELGNHIVRMKVASEIEGEIVRLQWRAYVLVGDRDLSGIHERTFPFPNEWPDETLQWLESTHSVDWKTDEIQAIGDEIRNETNDVFQALGGCYMKFRAIVLSPQYQSTEIADSCVASDAIERRGFCTSNANLFCSILRSSGIPARVCSALPAWSRDPFQMHYIVQAYLPGIGWYSVDPTTMEMGLQPHNQIIDYVVSAEDENRSKSRNHVAGGVPYHTAVELGGDGAIEDFAGLIRNIGDHHIKLFNPFYNSHLRLFHLAQAQWERCVASGFELKLMVEDPDEAIVRILETQSE